MTANRITKILTHNFNRNEKEAIVNFLIFTSLPAE